MTFNGVMALILRYFAEFVYDVVVRTSVSKSTFDSLWLRNLFSDYLGKTNFDNSVLWAYVHRWLGA